jgi:hypothetical protein
MNSEVNKLNYNLTGDILISQAGPVPNQNTGTETQYPDDAYNNPEAQSFWSQIPWFGITITIILLSGVAVALYFYAQKLKGEDRDKKTKDGVLFEVKVSKENELEIGVAEKMFSNLYSIGSPKKGIQKFITVGQSIGFEIVGLPGEIRFYVYAPKKLADLVEKQILGSYQDAEVNIVEEHNIFHEDSKVAFTQLELDDDLYYPLKIADDFKGDPLANLLSTVSKVGEGEGILVQLVISPAGKDWQKAGRGFINKVESNNSDPEKKRITVSQDQLQAINKKTNKMGFRTAIRIVATAPNEEIAEMHVDNVASAFDQFSNPGINQLSTVKIKKSQEREFMKNVIYRRMPLKDVNCILNVEELAAIYHLPNKDVTTPNINWMLAREVPAANWVNSDINSKDTIWIGNNEYRGKVKPICYMREDRRRHLYVLGQTGSGKSWNLVRMMVQDVYNGDGLCFMDPHGETAEMLLDRIPHERAEDVIYFNAGDYERPFGFNLMDYFDEQDKHRVVNGFIGLLKKLFDPHNQGIVGPILERAVRNSMLTAMSEKGSSLVEVVRILTDEDWVKEKWVPIIKDDLVRRYWTDQMAKTTAHQKSETLGYIVSKFDRFVTNMAIRNIIGQSESSFNMRQVMDSKKILIINLAKGIIGEENAQFLGLLVVPKIVSAALSRQDIPESERKDFFFYVDEFQNFATEEFASILSEARKYRLNLTMANQYIDQMPDDVRDAIFGNVGSLLVGRVGPEDSQLLEKQFEPTLSARDLMGQPNVHYYSKLLVDGKYPPPFSLNPGYGSRYKNSGFDIPVNKEVSDLIKKLSRLRYGRDVKVVEEEINKRADLAMEPDKANADAPPPLSLT